MYFCTMAGSLLVIQVDGLAALEVDVGVLLADLAAPGGRGSGRGRGSPPRIFMSSSAAMVS